MRAGAFTDKRVIDLLNRRFVTYFFNTGGPGLGRSADAEAFVKDKTANKWAFLAAFNAGGERLGGAHVYADREEVFTFLRTLLDAHPAYDWYTPEEVRTLAAGEARDATATAILAA